MHICESLFSRPILSEMDLVIPGSGSMVADVYKDCSVCDNFFKTQEFVYENRFTTSTILIRCENYRTQFIYEI
ncbi:unnamed protein product [Linum trigynum]|uniref:Uncharacterized protein n=1 Tax=Linum trigynum TaxID=586398 RepID=A0AAV2GNW2_9ROSI